jgi:hypothetical protein
MIDFPDGATFANPIADFRAYVAIGISMLAGVKS